MSEFKNTIETLMPFVKKVTGKDADKAIRDIARALAAALLETNIEVKSFIKSYDEDNILNPECLLNNVDDWHNFVKLEYRELCDVLFQLRPVGLGTPNAMVGEGELMFLFGSPRVGISKEKNKGDLTVNGKTVELKGYEFRVFARITGTELQTYIAEIAKKYKLSPNSVNGGKTAYEPWGLGKKALHWEKEFKRIGITESKKFLFEIMKKISPSFKINDIDSSFDSKTDKFFPEELQKTMAKIFFLDTKNEWDAFTVVTDKKIRTITSDVKEFAEMIDNNKLVISSDYIRSFQDIKIGLYVKFSEV